MAPQVAVHLEPYEGRTLPGLREDLIWWFARYNSSSALQRSFDGRPVFYVYDSYKSAPAEWAHLLCGGGHALRGTPLDGGWVL